jgi:hypothetical protein
MQRNLTLRLPAITHDELHLDPQVVGALSSATRQIICHGAYINADGEDVYLEDDQEHSRQNTVVYTPHQVVPAVRAKYPVLHSFVHNHTTLTVAHERAKLGYRVAIVHCGAVGRLGLESDERCSESVHRSSSMAYTLDSIALDSGMLPQYRDDTIVVLPQVPVFRTHDGDLLRAPWHADIVTAAPIETVPSTHHHPDRHAELPLLMIRRAERIVDAAAATGANVLVLGVWGCADHLAEYQLTAAAFCAAIERSAARAFAIVDVAAADTSAAQQLYSTYARRFHERIF